MADLYESSVHAAAEVGDICGFTDAGNLGTISRKLIQNGSKDYMSTYASMQKPLEAAFKKVFAEFEADK